MEKIFLVRGYSGEYSDYSQWPVVAMADETAANEYAKLCKEIADELYEEAGWRENRFNYPRSAHRLDPHFRADYTGTDYDVVAVPWGTITT